MRKCTKNGRGALVLDTKLSSHTFTIGEDRGRGTYSLSFASEISTHQGGLKDKFMDDACFTILS